MLASRTRRQGFTIVELLVVIGVLTVLMGLLLPALSGAQRRGRKADESNRIRQVGVAWNLYAQSNQDKALPGYLDAVNPGPGGEIVQEAWRVRYNFPDGNQVPDEDTQSWPWRLMQYFDYDQATLLGHLDIENTSQARPDDPDGYYAIRDRLPDGTMVDRPTHLALYPGFAYNAFYVGGWWDQWFTLEDGDAVPRSRFSLVHPVDRQGMALDSTTNVVVRSPANINSGSDFLLFCSASALPQGEHDKWNDIQPGSHVVVPPFLAEEAMWQKGASASVVKVVGGLDGASTAPVPIGRFTGQVATLYADLHTEPVAPGSLDDQRAWINSADRPLYRHTAD